MILAGQDFLPEVLRRSDSTTGSSPASHLARVKFPSAEEYEPKEKPQLGNFPQAFNHFALVNVPFALAEGKPMLHG